MSTYASVAGTMALGSSSLNIPRNPRSSNQIEAASVLRYAVGRMPGVPVDKVRALTAWLAREDRVDAVVTRDLDWTCCRCKIHEPMTCNVEGAEGCEGLTYGTHAAISALYTGNHRACCVEPGVRVLDKKTFDLVEFGVGEVKDPVSKFARGYGTNADRMGAFYCYTNWFPDSFVVRAARLLGPRPPKLRVLRYALVFGKPVLPGFRLQLLSNGDLHVDMKGAVNVSLYQSLVALVSTGNVGAKVGTDPAVVAMLKQLLASSLDVNEVSDGGDNVGVAMVGSKEGKFPVLQFASRIVKQVFSMPHTDGMKRLLDSLDVVPTEQQLVVYLLAATCKSMLPDGLAKVKEVHKVWAIHGDCVAKQFVTSRAVSMMVTSAEYSAMAGCLDNGSMARVLSTGLLLKAFHVEGLIETSKVRADVFEAFVGVLHMLEGTQVVDKFLARSLFAGKDFSVDGRQLLVDDSLLRTGLNSRQMEMAMAAARLGLLG